MLNAERRENVELGPSPIYVTLETSQSPKIGCMFVLVLADENLLLSEAEKTEMTTQLYISFSLHGKMLPVAFQIMSFQFCSDNFHFLLFSLHARVSQCQVMSQETRDTSKMISYHISFTV